MRIPVYSTLSDGQKKLTKIFALFALVGFVILAIISVILGATINSSASHPPSANSVAALSASIKSQGLFSYDNSTGIVPYSLLSYNETNGTSLYINVNLYSVKPPTSVYVLNWTGQCTICSTAPQVYLNLENDLAQQGVTNAINPLKVVSPQQLSKINNDSILIIWDGFLPNQTMQQVGPNYTVLDELMQKGTSLIYIGRSFGKLISPQSTIIPNPDVLPYLNTTTANATVNQYLFFNQSTFNFRNGQTFGAVSYESAGAGSGGYIIAFSNFLDDGWSTPKAAAADLSSVIESQFWLNKISSGRAILNFTNDSQSGVVGIPMLFPPLPNFPYALSELNRSYGTVQLYLLSTAPSPTNGIIGHASSTFVKRAEKIYFTGSYYLNGSIQLPVSVIPGVTYNSSISVYSVRNSEITPHIDIFTKDMQYVYTIPIQFTHAVTPGYTFIEPLNLNLGPGQYIAELNGFTNQRYGGTYFTVPSVNLTLTNINPNTDTFTFAVYAAGEPVSGLTANIILNGQYHSATNITDGQMVFTMPSGQSIPSGNLTFSMQMLSTTYHYYTSYSPLTFSINKQYIEFFIALIIVMLEVTLVKAPNRDEFYIDVPSMPEPAKIRVKLKSSEALSAFDSLNNYYRWKYMPLSKNEFRFAISNSVRRNNMPVTPTYNNVENMLDLLAERGYAVTADGLYAPKQWVEQSKHDIEYLAVFKKLRIYFVSNGQIFSDLDKSDVADIVTSIHNEKAYIIIYSKTSRFGKIPVFKNGKTYLAFLNNDRLEEFRNSIYNSSSKEAEQIKLYISAGYIILMDADNPSGTAS
jgi:hypothetical protein